MCHRAKGASLFTGLFKNTSQRRQSSVGFFWAAGQWNTTVCVCLSQGHSCILNPGGPKHVCPRCARLDGVWRCTESERHCGSESDNENVKITSVSWRLCDSKGNRDLSSIGGMIARVQANKRKCFDGAHISAATKRLFRGRQSFLDCCLVLI